MNKQRLYKFSINTISLTLLKVVDLVLTIWLIPFLILKVGLTNYGHYAFAMALMLLFVNVLNYGFNLTTVREIAKNKEDKDVMNSVFSEVFSVKLVLFIIELAVLLVLVFVFSKFNQQQWLYYFGLLIVLAEAFSLQWFFLGIEKMKYLTIIKAISTGLFIVLVIALVTKPSHYTFLPLFEGVALLVVNILFFSWVLKKYQIQLRWIGIHNVGIYLKSNFNSFINLLLPSTTGQLIVFLVGVLGVPAQVSLMQIGIKVSSAFSTLNAIFTKVLYPIVNRNKKMMKPSKFFLIGIGIGLSIFMYVSSPILVSYWLKLDAANNKNEVELLLKLLSTVPFLMAIISSYGINGLLVFYKDKWYREITIIATLVMVVSGFFLIPNYYYYGGAFAFLLGRIVYASLSFYYFKRI